MLDRVDHYMPPPFRLPNLYNSAYKYQSKNSGENTRKFPWTHENLLLYIATLHRKQNWEVMIFRRNGVFLREYGNNFIMSQHLGNLQIFTKHLLQKPSQVNTCSRSVYVVYINRMVTLNFQLNVWKLSWTKQHNQMNVITMLQIWGKIFLYTGVHPYTK